MTVKIEVSLSSILNEKVESLARELEVSRNELLSIAVQEFIERSETRRMMAALNEVYGEPPDEGKRAENPTEAPLTMFGAFPELAEIELGEEFEAVKQLGRQSIDKQVERIQGQS